MIREDAESEFEWTRSLARYEAETLLWKVLFEVGELVDLVDSIEDDEATSERFAKQIVSRFRQRRTVAKLRNVEGRTPEEAEAFLAAAARMESNQEL